MKRKKGKEKREKGKGKKRTTRQKDKKTKKMDQDIPNEVLEIIFNLVEPDDLFSLRFVCKKFLKVLGRGSMGWRRAKDRKLELLLSKVPQDDFQPVVPFEKIVFGRKIYFDTERGCKKYAWLSWSTPKHRPSHHRRYIRCYYSGYSRTSFQGDDIYLCHLDVRDSQHWAVHGGFTDVYSTKFYYDVDCKHAHAMFRPDRAPYSSLVVKNGFVIGKSF